MFTLKENLILELHRKNMQNISELANATGHNRYNVREKLYLAKKQGYIKDYLTRTINPTGGPIAVHIWEITDRGKEWATRRVTQ